MQNKRKICVFTVSLGASVIEKAIGNGINPMRWDEILGSIAQKNYNADKI